MVVPDRMSGEMTIFGGIKIFKKRTPSEEGQAEVLEEYRYCPSCGDEFRAEFLTCSQCGVELMIRTPKVQNQQTGREKDSEPAELTDEQDLIALRKGSMLELKRLKRLLVGEGVASLIVGDDADCSRGCCGGPSYILLIKSEDASIAQPLLLEDFKQTTALDTHAELILPRQPEHDAGAGQECPACGSRLSASQTACPDCGLGLPQI